MLRIVVLCALIVVSLGLPQRFTSSERFSLSSESSSLIRQLQGSSRESAEQNIRFNPVLTLQQDFDSTESRTPSNFFIPQRSSESSERRTSNRGRRPSSFVVSQRSSGESIEQNIRFNPVLAPQQGFGSAVGRTNTRSRTPSNFLLSQRNSRESIEQNNQLNPVPVLTRHQNFGSTVVRTTNRGRTPNNFILSQRNSDEFIQQNFRSSSVLNPQQNFGSTVARTNSRGRTPNNLLLSQINSEEAIDPNIRLNPGITHQHNFGSTVARGNNKDRSLYDYKTSISTPKFSYDCPEGQIRDYAGSCVFPDIIRDLYVFAEPNDSESQEDISHLDLPKPKVKYNLVVIRADEDEDDDDGPIIIPPPQEKTLVLVLNKEGEDGPRKVIEVPAGPDQRPEVFFVKYDEDDNTPLPGGITLQEALQHSISAGQSTSDRKSYGQH